MRRLAGLVLMVGCAGGMTAPPGPDASPTHGVDGGTSPGRARITITEGGAGSLKWAAFQDGEGPWQPVAGEGPTYTFEVAAGRYGVAFVCDAGGATPGGEVVHATVAELPGLTVFCAPAAPTTFQRLSGKISGVPAGTRAWLQVAGGFAPLEAPVTAYSIMTPPGMFDLGLFASAQGRATQALLRRDLAVFGDTVANLDFATEGVTLVRQAVHVTNGPPGPAEWGASTSLLTARDSFVWGDDDLAGTPQSYTGLPVTALRPQESQQVEIGVTDGPPNAQSTRGIIHSFRAPAPLDVALPAAFSSPKVSLAATAPTWRPRVTFQQYPGALYYQLVCLQDLRGATVTWLAIFSAAWLGDRSSYELPDWSGVPGFSFGLKPTGLLGETDAVLSTRDFSRTLHDDAATRDGAELKYARQSFVLTQ